MALIDTVPFVTARYSLDEASGTRVDTVNALDLTDHNTVTQNTGKLGQAAQFTAANSEYLSHADDALFSGGANDFTIAVWAWLDSKSGYMMLVAKFSNDAGGREYRLYYDVGSDRYNWFVVGASETQSVLADVFGSPATGAWHLVVARYNHGTGKTDISVNAGTKNETTIAGDMKSAAGSAFSLGTAEVDAGGSNFFNGRLDEVVIWKGHYLSDAEITELYNSGAGVSYATWSASAPVAPTLSSPVVPTGGTTLTATLSESGCIPTSGTGGFTLAGTTAAVASWAISGTTLTLTLSGTVYVGQTVTLSYDRSSTTDDISESTGAEFLADFADAAVTNNSTQVAPVFTPGFVGSAFVS